MHEFGRLEPCPLKLAPQTCDGAKPKLTVKEWHEPIPRRQITIAPGA